MSGLAAQVKAAAEKRYGVPATVTVRDGQQVVRVPSLQFAWFEDDFELALALLGDEIL